MIVIWVLFLAVGSVLIFHVENTIHFKNAQKDAL